MLLKELFLVLPEDYAIRPLNSTPQNLPTFDPMYAKVVGTQDSIDVWGSREKRNFEIFGFKNDEEVTAYIIIEEAEVRANTVRLRELWVKEDQRGKGYATGLLLFLTRKLKIKLMLDRDEVASSDARAIIKKSVEKGLLKADINSNLSIGDALADLKKNDIEIILYERANYSNIFGARMMTSDGCSTFAEHALINVSENSEHD